MLKPEKEKELVKGLRDGISWSFNELFKLYADKVYRFAFSYLKSEEISKEIVQDTFMVIWVMHKTINPEQSFKSLLFTLAYNNVMTRFREKTKEKKYREFILASATEYYDQEKFFLDDDIQLYVNQTIDKLPPRRKEIFILRKEYNLSYKEISEKLGISIKTVENNINQAIKFIKGQVGTEAPVIIFFSFLLI